MRKNILSLSIATLIGGLGLAGGAAAGTIEATVGSSAAALPDRVLATNATNLAIAPSGVGHILMVPYFTAQNGNVTGISITNTDTKNGKAVKVRFRGASNSDDLLDFQVYMSPGDVWTAGIVQGADGRAQLVTQDNSCTLPAGVGAGAGQYMGTGRLPSFMTADQQANETREGYIEIFNMADIPPLAIIADNDTPTSGANKKGEFKTDANKLYTAIKHVAQGGKMVPPCGADFAAIVDQSTDISTDTAAYLKGMSAPTGTLSGNYFIYNGPDSSSWSGEATAVAAVDANAYAAGRIVWFPQYPTNVTNADNYTADPSLRSAAGVALGSIQNGDTASPLTYSNADTTATIAPIISPLTFDFPDLSTPYVLAGNNTTGLSTGLDAATGATAAAAASANLLPLAQAFHLSSAIETTSIRNDYVTDPGILATTDWLFSMPTRRYNVAADYRGGSADKVKAAYTNYSQLFGAALLGGGNFFGKSNTSVVNGQICADTGSISVYDREEGQQTPGGSSVSPGVPGATFKLCGEVSVLSINTSATAASALGAKVARFNLNTNLSTGKDGWITIPTPAEKAVTTPLVSGLPVVGAAFITMKNAAARPGVEGNYGITWRHRTAR